LIAFVAVASLLAIGFLFSVLPMIALAPLIYYFMPKTTIHFTRSYRSVRVDPKNNAETGAIIDVEFRVIEENTDPEQS
jgi:hypothetical protein